MAVQEQIDDRRHEGLACRVAQRIRECRQHRKLRLTDLADRCNTTAQTIQRLETAKMTISLDWLEALCRAMEIDVIELFCGEDSELKRIADAVRNLRCEAATMQLRATQFSMAIDDFMQVTDKNADQEPRTT